MSTESPESAGHVPVLLQEVLDFLAVKPGGVYCDATLGLGGHAEGILGRCDPDGRLFGIDRDPMALEKSRDRLGHAGDRASFLHGRFGEIHEVLTEAGAPPLDGCLVDVGVSSMQLDVPERGFSFRNQGPLDMRMDPSQGESAADLVSRLPEEELASILWTYGEERNSRRIARAIVADREATPFTTTTQLSSLIGRVVRGRERGKDPATRSFQALRIAVNDELGEIDRFLSGVLSCLKPGGRLVLITFHSLEDRLVKHRLRDLAGKTGKEREVTLLTKHVVTASDEECARNPRSRSAKLRAVEKVTI